MAVALEAAAAQEPETDSAEPLLSSPRLLATLHRFVQAARANGDEGLRNLTQAAEQLEITRTSVYAWIHDKRLLAWNATRRGPVVPAEQILGPRRCGRWDFGIAQDH